MNCERCNGLAVIDDSIGVQTGFSADFHGWRCVNCGMIFDDVINQNRQVDAQRKTVSRSDRHRYSDQAA